MDNREEQFGTNDLGLLLFVFVSVWVLLTQSSLF
jgi:hypothetical protein